MQEGRTALSPAEVLDAAKRFFGGRNAVYTAFLERESPSHVVMRGQGGEELVVATDTKDGATRVTGSSYLFDQQIARFLATLPPAPGTAS